jgi:hypothetical protein
MHDTAALIDEKTGLNVKKAGLRFARVATRNIENTLDRPWLDGINGNNHSQAPGS